MSREDVMSEADLTLDGIFLLENVLRDETEGVLNTVRAAGIDNVMVTGSTSFNQIIALKGITVHEKKSNILFHFSF